MWGLIDLEDFNCLLPTTYFYNVTNDSLVPHFVKNRSLILKSFVASAIIYAKGAVGLCLSIRPNKWNL